MVEARLAGAPDVDPDADAALAARWWQRATWLAIGLGGLLRLRWWLLDRSLWLDEALLATNVVERSYGGLLDPLGGQQGAPVGYLWLLRAIVDVAGPGERWLRLPALVGGLAVLVLTPAVLRRLWSARVAAVATVSVAAAPGLVRYSAEVKQYSTDVAVVLVLVLLYLRTRGEPDRTGLAAFGLAGALALWCAHPAPLVLAGLGLLLLVDALRPGDRDVGAGVVGVDLSRLVPVALVGLAWAVSAAVLYVVSLRDLTENEFLTSYWAQGFPARGFEPTGLGAWWWDNTVDLLGEHAGLWLPVLASAALLYAVVRQASAGRASAVAVSLAWLPALTVVAALDLYPYRGRLALFTLPLLLGLVVSVVDRDTVADRVAAAAVLVGLAGAVVSAVDDVGDPLRFPDARPVLEFVAERARPADLVFVHGLTDAPARFYGPDLGVAIDGITLWRPSSECAGPSALDALSGTVWIVYAYTHSASPPNEREILLTHLDAIGARTDVVLGHDALAARYDLDAAPGDPTGDGVLTTLTTGCLRARPTT